ncbi:hypothetical protein GKC30_06565 [Pseudodesulfovibrio sp. F-1]|uniref:Uncharacterized protein n=1 Tax=Pseudodesulfovibrio alkaliphilus TaxID=2661613 RepID=A0A7K1KML7_9BACT|nr:hypothetical protein [Pseudodesulfovibrio alkaliphilus]MUM77290.1 hypothetical protein [Pseudodesulfovibrio alkaliphilus]
MNRRDLALALFVAVTAVEGLAHGLILNTPDAWTTGVLALVVFSALSWMARQGRPVPLWTVVLVMLITATRHLMAGAILLLAESDPAGLGGTGTGILRLAAGAVLVWAGLTVFLGRHRQDDHG